MAKESSNLLYLFPAFPYFNPDLIAVVATVGETLWDTVHCFWGVSYVQFKDLCASLSYDMSGR